MHSVRKMLDTTHEISVGLTDKVTTLFISQFPEPFTLVADRSVQVGALEAPTLEYRGKALNLDFTAVDELTRNTGGVATIFVRQGDDFIRVSTSLKTDKGERAIGTRLGADHPARARLLAGDSYLGNAKLFGRHYMTKYVPARDRDGKVVGVLFVGFDLTSVFASLKSTIDELKFGTHGYAYVFHSQGKERGVMLFHPQFAGKDSKDLKDANGELLMEKMMAMPAGSITYPWQDPDGTTREKLALFEQTDSLGGLVVACGGYVTDFTAGSAALRNMILLASGVAALLLAALLYAFITRQLRPVRKIVQALERIGAGDLQARIGRGNDTGPTRNELDIIARSIDASTASMGQLIGELRQQSREVEGTAAALSQVSRALADNAATQSNAASAMAAGVEELAVSINILSDNARSTDSSVRETRELASQGREASGAAVSQMANIEQAVADAAGQIKHLGEASRQISSVVSVIREVADQTNLLALNAAIEAARAGEQGRGFAVVADEVRKLAERTAASTQEISRVVDSIQSGAGEAIAGMHAARGRVGEGVVKVEDSGARMAAIESGASSVAALASDMSNALAEQASAGNAIGEEVERISRLSEQNDAASQEAFQAAARLEQLASRMAESVARFSVAA
ncbi:methyl-accepting chemotaxis protein [Zoogloea ramigera]|uniref:Methyl-accepting chemotaxis protein n=1 Tax=Zoogloea ramigera TaxID=350 RepID=A0A4Y4CZJ3_ZOORA|nr:methyl-accepting chemotaxis protein [Zoogloea ramigera]